jgi:hypothetical protein
VPHAAVLARVRVQPGDGQPGVRDAEIARQRRRRDRGARADKLGSQQLGTARSGTWTVTGTTRRLGPASIITAFRGDAAGFGDEFGLPWLAEADRGKAALGDGAGDDARRGAGPGKAGRRFQRAQRQRRAGFVGLAGV